MADEPVLLTSHDGGVVTLTLNRPRRRRNAINDDMWDADDEVRVVLLIGAGRGFCAGADLEAGANTLDVNDQQDSAAPAGFGTVGGAPRDFGRVVELRASPSRKPVIAAINGPRRRGWCVDDAARRRANRGVVRAVRVRPPWSRPRGCLQLVLLRMVGISQAMEWVATGRLFDAGEALSGRLVSRVVLDAELLPAARALAAEIVANTSAVSVELSRQMLWSMLGAETLWKAHRLDSRAVFHLGQGPEAKVGCHVLSREAQVPRPNRRLRPHRARLAGPAGGHGMTAAMFDLHSTRVRALQCDVGDEQAVRDAFAETLKTFGRVDSCFANAGVTGGRTPSIQTSLEEFRRKTRVNLHSAFLTLRARRRTWSSAGAAECRSARPVWRRSTAPCETRHTRRARPDCRRCYALDRGGLDRPRWRLRLCATSSSNATSASGCRCDGGAILQTSVHSRFTWPREPGMGSTPATRSSSTAATRSSDGRP